MDENVDGETAAGSRKEKKEGMNSLEQLRESKICGTPCK